MFQIPSVSAFRGGLSTVAAVLLLFACSGSSGGDAPSDVDRPVSGRLRIEEFQLAYIGSGTTGHGTLNFRGDSYRVRVGGLGVGGIGLAEIKATGEVYDLGRLEDFPGLYGQARTGWAVGQAGSGKMWLQNNNGVVLHLHAERERLMLSLGADAIDIQFEN